MTSWCRGPSLAVCLLRMYKLSEGMEWKGHVDDIALLETAREGINERVRMLR